MVFIFHFDDVVYHLDRFGAIEEALHPWDKSYFIMVYDLLVYFCTQFVTILLSIFASIVISEIGLPYAVFVVPLSALGIRAMVTP